MPLPFPPLSIQPFFLVHFRQETTSQELRLLTGFIVNDINIMSFKAQVAIAALCAILLAVVPVQFSSTSKFFTRDSAQLSRLPKELRAADSHQRSLLLDRAAIVNGKNVPAWRGRFDTVFGRTYFAPATVTNKCDSDQNCTGLISGRQFPYEEYLLDPTTPTGRPVMKVSYPAGAWSTSAAVPGGTLFYAYPYKWDPSSAADPFSATGATMEYEVFLPTDFPFVKGE